MTEIQESFSFEEYEKNLDNTITKHKQTIESFQSKEQQRIDSSIVIQNKLLIKENNTLKQKILDLKEELKEINSKYKSIDTTLKEYDEKIKMLSKLIADNDTDVKEKYIKGMNILNTKMQKVQKFLYTKNDLLFQFGIKDNSDQDEDIENNFKLIDIFIDKLITDNKNLIESNEQMKKYFNDMNSQLHYLQNEKRNIEEENNKLKQESSMIKIAYENTITQIKTENDKLIQKIETQNENAIKILKCEKENAITQLQQLKTENIQLQSTLNEIKHTEKAIYEQMSVKDVLKRIYKNPNEEDYKEIQNNQIEPNPLANLKTKLEMLECMLKDTSVDSPSIITEENI